jgi:predicted enzyme involved in methoxymalonyl-ACP biosynthesis
VEELHPNTRKSLAKKLCDLDDERRLAWDAIDAWSEGKTVEPTLEANSFSDDVLAKGMQIARRMERLKENINRAKESAGNADRETIKESALKRIEKYEKELAELQALVTPQDEQATV